MTRRELSLFAHRLIRKEVTTAELAALTAEELLAINLYLLERQDELNTKTQQLDEKKNDTTLP